MKKKKCALTKKQIRNRIKWERALCSSVKTKGTLTKQQGRKRRRYCCLGVACHVLGVADNSMEDLALPISANVDMGIEFGLNRETTFDLAILNDGIYRPEYKSKMVEMSHEEISLFLSIEREAYQMGDLEIWK